MMKPSFRGLLAVLFSAGVMFSGYSTAMAADQPSPTASPSVVMDGAHIFSSSEVEALTSAIQKDDQTYGLVFVVETVPSLNGQPIEKVALDRANQLGVGQVGKNNGVFIYMSRDDHKIRFELGTGVTPKVSDSAVSDIINTDVTPQFKQGDFAAGIEAGMAAVGQKYSTAPAGLGISVPFNPVTIVLGLIIVVLGILFLIVIFVRMAEDKADAKLLEDKKDQIKATGQEIRNSATDVEEYENLPDQKARRAWIKEHYPETDEVIGSFYRPEEAMKEHLDRDFYAKFVLCGDYATKVFGHHDQTEASIEAILGKSYAECSISEVNKFIREADEQCAELQKDDAKAKETVRNFWESLSPDKQAELSKALSEAKTLPARNSVVTDYGLILFALAPLLIEIYLPMLASDLNGGGSYDGGSSDSGSFDGGSFGGDGGTGSW